MAMLAGCSSGSAAAEPSAGLPVVVGCFVTHSGKTNVSLELAQASQEREHGLMGRADLEASSGMLFQYQEQRSSAHGFWMYQTLIPLDIAYMDEKGVIRNIQQMTPCTSAIGARCPTYPAGVKFISAVEMNFGFLEANGIGVGDSLSLGQESCKGR